jgi:methylthioribulose-1-phosphate dehydratase
MTAKNPGRCSGFFRLQSADSVPRIFVSDDPMADPLLLLAHETKRIADLGFMACTAGNSSVLVQREPLLIAMSPSGVDKTSMTLESFIAVGADGKPQGGDGRKPSDETLLHIALYQHSGCGAVMHGHPVHAVALSLDAEAVVAFRGIEMQKAFSGTMTHDCTRRLAVIDNSQDMGELAARAVAALAIATNDESWVPALLVRGHGVYAWGRTPSAAARHLEAVEWLSRVSLLSRSAGVRQL